MFAFLMYDPDQVDLNFLPVLPQGGFKRKSYFNHTTLIGESMLNLQPQNSVSWYIFIGVISKCTSRPCPLTTVKIEVNSTSTIQVFE